MKNKIYIDVPKPCHENWQEMTPVEQGRHCNVCSKNVIDFTAFSDKELLDFLSTPQQNVCGRFNNQQLNREIAYPKTPQKYSLSTSWLFGLSLLAVTIATALPITTYATPTVIEQSFLNEEVKNTDGNSTRIIRGIVTDEYGEELVGATVLIKNTKISAATNVEGRFTLKIPKKYEDKEFSLKISLISYVTKEYLVKVNEDSIKIALPEDMITQTITFTMGRMSNREYLTQRKVYGKIVSEEDSIPIAGATVFLSNSKHKKTIFGDTTDAEGNYSFDLPLNYNDSVFSIRFEKEGKQTKVIESIISSNLKKPLNITLSERVYGDIICTYPLTRWQKVKRFFYRMFH